jgi:hypothetical protein
MHGRNAVLSPGLHAFGDGKIHGARMALPLKNKSFSRLQGM